MLPAACRDKAALFARDRCGGDAFGSFWKHVEAVGSAFPGAGRESDGTDCFISVFAEFIVYAGLIEEKTVAA